MTYFKEKAKGVGGQKLNVNDSLSKRSGSNILQIKCSPACPRIHKSLKCLGGNAQKPILSLRPRKMSPQP